MGESRSGVERRVHERVAFEGEANVTSSIGGLPCKIVDISRGGLALRSKRSALPGEFVRVRLSVPKELGTPSWIDPDAVVVRAQAGPDDVLWAVTFASPDPARDALLTRLVDVFRNVSPEDRLRAGTRDQRNRAIQELLAPCKTARPATRETARPATRETARPATRATARPATRETARPPTGETVRAPSRPRRKRPTGEMPRGKNAGDSQELKALYEAAIGQLDRDAEKKKKRKR